jgi:hypothetical protein
VVTVGVTDAVGVVVGGANAVGVDVAVGGTDAVGDGVAGRFGPPGDGG